MRECWNWQTGTFEGRVLHDVRVQVPSLAPDFDPENRMGMRLSGFSFSSNQAFGQVLVKYGLKIRLLSGFTAFGTTPHSRDPQQKMILCPSVTGPIHAFLLRAPAAPQNRIADCYPAAVSCVPLVWHTMFPCKYTQ